MVRACAVAGIHVTAPFPPHGYTRKRFADTAVDKPDLRFGMELHDVTIASRAERSRNCKSKATCRRWRLPGSRFSRKQIDELAEKAKSLGARGAYSVKVTGEGITSAAKNDRRGQCEGMADACGARPAIWWWPFRRRSRFPAPTQRRWSRASCAGAGRSARSDPQNQWEFLWITGFPLFEWSRERKAWVSAQHPFTGIVEEDLDKLETEPWEVRSKGYDLVLNG